MDYLIIIVGMLATLWSGFFIGYYKREDKAPEIPFVSRDDIFKRLSKAKEKPVRRDRDKEKENTFLA